MAEERGKESDWWLKCQGTRLRQKARHEFETSPAGRRLRMKKKLTSEKTAKDPDSRINKALRKWKC